MILQSLVKSADKNLDEAMDLKEFEGFGDFELVFKRWPQMWWILYYPQMWQMTGMNTCDGGEGTCFPSSWTTGDLMRCFVFPNLSDADVFFRYFSKQEVVVRLIMNFVFHEDLQFPGWTLED